MRISIVASSDAEGAISRTEVRVDGDLVATSETGSIDVPALELAGGQHRLELRILLDAPADESGAAVVWSTSELFRVEALAEPESGGGAPASVVTEVLLLPGARPVARRLEARFHGARAAFESGTVPRIEAVTSVLDQAVALGRDGSGDPVVDADQRIERMIAAVDELDAGVATARAARDIILLNCINDKLVQLGTALTSARERRTALLLARRDADTAALSREHAALVDLSRRADTLLEESRSCVGYTLGDRD